MVRRLLSGFLAIGLTLAALTLVALGWLADTSASIGIRLEPR